MTSSSVNCQFTPQIAAPSTTTTTKTPPTTTPQPSIRYLDCDFESTCNWKNDAKNAKVNWVIRKADSQLSSFSPSSDHTLGTSQGSYLTLDKQTFISKSISGYESPRMNQTKCLEFWYFNYGTAVIIDKIEKTF
jgi:hypothetical protein